MVKISILYPNTPESTFDIDCLRTHMPMSLERLRAHPGFIALSVERGVAAPQSGLPPAYVAMCHYTFTTAEDFVASFIPHAAALQGDMANYTTIVPVIQFSIVEIAESR